MHSDKLQPALSLFFIVCLSSFVSVISLADYTPPIASSHPNGPSRLPALLVGQGGLSPRLR
ncbi:hypothetical protein LZ32DRAFT_605940 [Colletotrichum eremochloae]|nr:hypothetical protein LZ32DRAFT_605940 [Colletotrichum eremochloae]